jgi:uncharacterized protein with WD repeat
LPYYGTVIACQTQDFRVTNRHDEWIHNTGYRSHSSAYGVCPEENVVNDDSKNEHVQYYFFTGTKTRDET